MLETLTITNFALIESVRLNLSNGLTTITGETGAGKSTLISAIRLIQGGRATASQIRTGTNEARVEATFSVKDNERLLNEFRAKGFPTQRKIFVTRILRRQGKNSVTLNHKNISLVQLAELMEGLIEVSSQHESQTLRSSSAHLSMVDQAGQLHDSALIVSDSYAQLAKIDDSILEATQIQQNQLEREDFLKYQLEELSRAQLSHPDEDEQLRQEAARLKHAERLKEAALRTERLLDTQQGAVTELLSRALNDLETLSEVDTNLTPYKDDIFTALALVEEVARSISSYGRHLSSNPQALDELEERLSFLNSLKKKYGGSLPLVIEKFHTLEREIESFSSLDERITRLNEQRRIAAQTLLTYAQALSEARRAFSQRFCHAVERELSDLGMPQARLEIQFEDLYSGQGCDVDGQIIGPRGLERATLLISANPGEPALPLHTAASGGELSRITLAIKRVIADQDPVATYIFDEVDSGVGGPTAEALGWKLRLVGQQRQVLCITHLPQIAAMGDHQLFVTKQVKGNRTRSIIRPLNTKQRIEEISRMLGGTRITDRTRANAQELLAVSQVQETS